MIAAWNKALAEPLGIRDFRNFLIGLAISNVGSYAQFTAFAFVVTKYASAHQGSIVYVALVAAARALPTLFLTPFAPQVLDRIPDRVVAIAANGLFAAQALLIALLLTYSEATLASLCIVAAIAGVAGTFEGPARTAFIRKSVGQDSYAAAAGLQSAAFSLPGILFPIIVGLFIDRFGVVWPFLLNAITTTALLFALATVQNTSTKTSVRIDTSLGRFRDVIRELRNSAVLRNVLISQAVLCVASSSTLALLPWVVVDVFRGNATSIGVLFTLQCIVAFVVGLLLPKLSRRDEPELTIRYALLAVFAVGVIGCLHNYVAFIVATVVLMFSSSAALSCASVALQQCIGENYRARISLLNSFLMLGVAPLAAIGIARASAVFSIGRTLPTVALLSAAVLLVLLVRPASLSSLPTGTPSQ